MATESRKKSNAIKYGAVNRRMLKAEVLYIKDRTPPANNRWSTFGRFPRQNALWSDAEDAYLRSLVHRFVSGWDYDAEIDRDWRTLSAGEALAQIGLLHGRNVTSIMAHMRLVCRPIDNDRFFSQVEVQPKEPVLSADTRRRREAIDQDVEAHRDELARLTDGDFAQKASLRLLFPVTFLDISRARERLGISY